MTAFCLTEYLHLVNSTSSYCFFKTKIQTFQWRQISESEDRERAGVIFPVPFKHDTSIERTSTYTAHVAPDEFRPRQNPQWSPGEKHFT